MTTIVRQETTDSRARWLGALRIGFGIMGLVAVGFMIARSGPAAIAAALRAAARWLPLLFALEVGRIFADVLATRSALGPRASRIPWAVLVRGHLIAYAVGGIAPAGRTAAEATKAALFARWVGGAAATAAGATNQAVTLVAVAIFSVPCAIASWQATGVSVLTIALVVHGVALGAMGAALRGGMRARSISGWLARRLGRYGRHATAFQEAASETGLLPMGTLAAMLGGRVLQTTQFAVLAYAVGVDLTLGRALVSQGINLVVMAVGVLVPSQIGAAEGAFALSAGALGTTVPNAMVIALVSHIVQIVFVVIGSLTPLVWSASTAWPETSE